MPTLYQITSGTEFSGATIQLGGETYTVNSDHPKYKEILTHLLAGVEDEDHLLSLVNPGISASKNMMALSDRVSYRGGKLFWDNDPIDWGVAKHIVRSIESGQGTDVWGPLVKFMENVASNPSHQSRIHLYGFIQANSITLDQDGYLILYKSVQANRRSTHSGYGIVDGVIYEHAELPNEDGSVIEIPRSMVDTDRGAACSTGLHVANYRFASTFSTVLLRVRVHPRDVVSVPADSNGQKIRVCRYTVLGAYADEVTTPIYSTTAPVDTEDAADDEDDEVTESSTDVSVDEEAEEANDEAVWYNNTISEFLAIIPKLQADGVNLRNYRNKRVSSKRRPVFDNAMRTLGLSW